MDSNVLTATITTAGTVLVAITALLLNSKRFDLIEKRLDKMEHTLELIQSDLKEFYKDIARLKVATGLDR